jgi:excisionase family DNA binding protein
MHKGVSNMKTQPIVPDLTVDQAALEMAVSRVHIYRMMGNGSLAGYKVGKSTRIKRESLDAFKAGNPWVGGIPFGQPDRKQATP